MALVNPIVAAAAAGSAGSSPAAAGSAAAQAGAPLVPIVLGPALGAPTTPGGKDSRWLTLEVCREFARSKCSRSDEECKYAHPPPHVEIQNGRVMCCFDSIKGKCQRKEPPCKYLHPPQHLKEILLQNGRQNLIYKNLQLQASTFQQLSAMPTMIPVMYEPGSGLKQQTLLQSAASYHQGPTAYHNGTTVMLPGPSAGPHQLHGQYITMIPQGNSFSAGAQQYILPPTSYPCYSPLTATAGPNFYQQAAALDMAGSGLMTPSLAQGPILSPQGATHNQTWSLGGMGGMGGMSGLPAGCYSLPSGSFHTISYDTNSLQSLAGHYQQQQQVAYNMTPSSALPCAVSSAGTLVAADQPSGSTDGSSSPPMTSSAGDVMTATSSAYCQPLYYKRQVVEVMQTAGGGAAGLGRKRPHEATVVGPPAAAEEMILGNGLVVKRPALIDAKTGLPVYRQFATAASYQQMAAQMAVQQLQQQQQQYYSVPIASQVLPRF